MTTVRLNLRLHRLELTIFAVGLLMLCGIGVGMSLAFNSSALVPCLVDPTAEGCVDGLARAATLSNTRIFYQLVLSVVSILAGFVLGVGVVAKEVEYGTATLAWTIYPSRIRWLVPRVAIAIGVIVVLVAPAAFAADAFERARQVPQINGDSMQDYQVRGLPVVARATLAFAIALVIGARMGRMLPALLLALALFAAIAGVIEFGLSSWLTREAEPITDPGALYMREAYRATDGRVLESSEAFSIVPPEDPRFQELFEPVSVGIPGARTREAVARTTIVYVVPSMMLIGGTILVVNRRRPT